MDEESPLSVEAAIQRLCQVLMEPENSLEDEEHSDDSDDFEGCSTTSYLDEFRAKMLVLEEMYELTGETLKLIALHRDQSDSQLLTLQLLYTRLMGEANELRNLLHEAGEMEHKLNQTEDYISRFNTVCSQMK
ncbi:hypothetical protein AND_009759 [Anopheles darlingi]|uniref:Uncharacterized protein n=1 Tax=Anopheles darlingi TaxID=43151 RepID=W5J4A9_ANODA|nr:hypothetical protein AND_009759 [Anopheles darlingi]